MLSALPTHPHGHIVVDLPPIGPSSGSINCSLKLKKAEDSNRRHQGQSNNTMWANLFSSPCMDHPPCFTLMGDSKRESERAKNNGAKRRTPYRKYLMFGLKLRR
jgi:hypothetical protein